MSDTVTVKVWEGPRFKDYDELLEEEPDKYQMPVVETEFGRNYEARDEDRVTLARDIENHWKYAFDVETDEKVKLRVNTNDSYHNPEDWDGPIGGGLLFSPEDDYPPFKCELWGRVMMWVEEGV